MIGEVLTFPVHGDKMGSLVALEKGADFPFEIKRVYYIWGTAPSVVRGHHAHRGLEQVVVCTSGSCDFILDDGMTREMHHLDSPTKGLHIKNNVWREFTNFSSDCVVMVLASEHYNEADFAYPYLLPLMRNPKFVSTYSRDELFDSVLHPKIIHYAGHKPWRSADVGYDDEWWAIADYLRLNLPRPRKIQPSAYDRARSKMFYYRNQVKWLVLALAVAILIIIAAITRIDAIQSVLT